MIRNAVFAAGTALGALALALVIFSGPPLSFTDGAYAAAPPSVRARPARADTLRPTVRAGETLILALPDSLDARPVAAYAVVRAPALSWLVDRSFLWRTRPGDAGTHRFLFEAAFAEAPPETLVVRVNVEPRR
ncbi:hypothetical protein [Rhodocaloribacter sp.]